MDKNHKIKVGFAFSGSVITGIVLLISILLLSNAASADISQYMLGCNNDTSIGADTTNLTCGGTDLDTSSLYTGLLNSYGSSTKIEPPA